MIDQETPANGATATEPNEILRSLTLRHQPNGRICVCCYTKNGDAEFHNQQTFVDGIIVPLVVACLATAGFWVMSTIP
jgi:hypothetical protein